MATPSSILVWEIPWTEEPGGLLSMGPQRVRHDLATKQQQDSVPFNAAFWGFSVAQLVKNPPAMREIWV